jgi:hypothetical protein
MKIKKVSKSPITCSGPDLVASRFRQIHLDFHTSELIPDVGAAFDADTFGDVLDKARVNWITLFAKCHHGMSYYPTQAGTIHPSLKFDLLGEQIEACRKRGIVTPAYISVRVDEHNAKVHHDWIGHMKDNKYWKWSADPLTPGWNQLCMNNKAYVDELEAQAVEVLKWYDVEGLFFDMCYSPTPGCYCPRCYDSMKRRGLDFASNVDHQKHEFLITREYTQRLARAIRKVKKNATIFFNGRMRPGIAEELDVFTHIEIEALPTGGWGYAFFPINARYGRVLPRPLQGMTARFHKSWADFGGLKTPDQLMFETGTILSATAVMNVGDQCHPRGELDQGAYEVIGQSFRHVEKCEPWCVEARAAAEIGVMMMPGALDGADKAAGAGTMSKISESVDGAGRMLLELKQQFNLIYPDTDLSPYKVVILPDNGVVEAPLKLALKAFVAGGGAVIASYKASLQDGKFQCPGLPVRYLGDNPNTPCYLDLGPDLGKNWPKSKFVFYEASTFVKPAAGATSLGRLVGTYFNRAYDHFCSHNQTPYDKTTPHPVAVVKGRMAYISTELFKAYRNHSYSLYKAVLERVLNRVLPEPLVRAHAPSAMEISINRQLKPKRLVAHLVNFQPQRRHINIEWIEELYPVRDIPLAVRTGKKPKAVVLAPSGEPLPFHMEGDYCHLVVPEVKAHQMIAFEGI